MKKMTAREAKNWQRFFMIRGPAGEERLDMNFAWVRQALTGHKIEDCQFKFDHRRYFPKDDVTEEIAELLDIDADMAFFEKRFGKSKTQ